MNIEQTLPLAFRTQMQALLGEEYGSFGASLASPSPTSIRINPLKSVLYQGQTVPWSKDALYLPERPDFSKDPLWHAGCFYVQEAGSMFTGHIVSQLIQGLEHPRVLDLCAAPGGKSTQLAALLYKKGLLVANEVVKSRWHILHENMTKWGYPNTVLTTNDPSHFSKIGPFFDILVVDAPCSGEGLFRKQPEAVQEWSEKAVSFCAGRQRRILEDVWSSLKPGGFLVYSTCTYNTLENEENVAWLAEEFGAEPYPVDCPFPEIKKDGVSSSFRFYPHRTQSEGFFISVLRKPYEEYAERRLFVKKNYFHKISKEEASRLDGWISSDGLLPAKQQNGIINILPLEFVEEIEYLAHHLKVLYCGTEIAEVKGKDINPLQGLANSICCHKEHFSTISLGEEDALKYLSKQDVEIGGQTGINLALHDGFPLGWLKKMANRVNNYYPQEWRLRNM